MKKQLVSFFLLVFFSPLVFSSTFPSSSLNIAPPSFPTAQQAFKKIYAGTLSLEDAQTQPWYESYEFLYKTMNNNNSDSTINAMLTNLQQQAITPDIAAAQFKTAQTSLKTNADNVFSS